MEPELKQALQKMGYRHMGNDIWGKPIAYHLLIVRMIDNKPTMVNHCMGIQNQLLIWDRQSLESDNYESSLKMAEFSTSKEVVNGGDFGFLTTDQQISALLDC